MRRASGSAERGMESARRRNSKYGTRLPEDRVVYFERELVAKGVFEITAKTAIVIIQYIKR